MALCVQQGIAPQQAGPLAIAQIFVAYLFFPLAAVAVVAAVTRSRAVVAALGLAVGVAIAMFGPGLVSALPDAPNDARQITVYSWNILATNRDVEGIRARILASDAAIVALQELSFAQADALQSDTALTERYPYRVVRPARGFLGMATFSRYPIMQHGELTLPPLIWTRLAIDDDQTLLVVNAHPLPGVIDWIRVAGVPLAPLNYDPARRDEQLDRVTAVLATTRRPNEPVLLVGDFNVSEREPIYRTFTRELTDAHAVVGLGPGNTWKSWFLIGLPVAIIRIDYLFSSPELTPLRITTDCGRHGSDHCALRGVYALAPTR
ncbi:MAG: endonuclease/exonuclease/phosphatase family protein [Dehalococcoidia bacterium]|nr:endonuclease/exonuclease/phosphatase family protein [Dehalococcoidia bacterium]